MSWDFQIYNFPIAPQNPWFHHYINLPSKTIFCLFWIIKFTKQQCVLTDLSMFWEDGKKFVPSESRISFCQLFIVRVKKICYESKVREKLLGCFLHCTLECLCPYVPPTSFMLMALWNKEECQCYNETNIPPC